MRASFDFLLTTPAFKRVEIKPRVHDWSDDQLNDMRKTRAEQKMKQVDRLSPELRALVHEYGWEPVKCLMDLGARGPRQILHIIRACRGEAK